MKTDRRRRLQQLFEGPRFRGDRAKFTNQSGLTKGRVTQLFDSTEPFGERAARSLAEKLGLDADYFDLPDGSPLLEFDAETIEFARAYSRMTDQERQRLRLLIIVARDGVNPTEISKAPPMIHEPGTPYISESGTSGFGDLAETPSPARKHPKPKK